MPKAKKQDVPKRMTVKEIRNRLETQVKLSKRTLEGCANALPSFDALKEVEHARANLSFCRELLSEMDVHKK